MTTQSVEATPPSAFAPRLILLLGWSFLLLMVAYLLNNVLTFWLGWPGLGPSYGGPPANGGGGGAALSYVQLALYGAALAVAAWLAFGRDGSFRAEARMVNDFNTYFIRGCFWAVLLIGVADAVVSFMRIEEFMEPVLGETISSALRFPNGRALYLHTPLGLLGFVLAAFTRTLGFHWLALFVVIAELLIVVGRFVFSYEQAFMADLVRFWYSALFLFASAYTLLEDGHVRVDVIYSGFGDKAKGYVNAIGAVVLGALLCWTILLVGTWGKANIINAPILAFEVTQSSFGAYVKYLMAGFLGVFAVSMMIQFVVALFDGVADIREEPGRREPTGASAQ